MNKREQRQKQLDCHYKTLERFAKAIGAKNTDGKKLSLKLLKLERIAHQAATDYCNGVLDDDEWAETSGNVKKEILKAFEVPFILGLFINGDPRGYAIKIDDAIIKEKYQDVGLYRDMGGYGILSPEIE